MKYIKQLRAGISLRVIHAWLIVVTVLMSVVMVYSTIRLSSSFTRVTDATEEHLELEKAALELMDASDYLTEKVQRFTIGGDRRFMDEYFEEAFKSHRREEALDRMNAEPAADTAREKLEKANKAKEKAEAEAKRAAEGVGPYKEKLEAASREAEELRKKLRAAESGAGEVAMLARQAQVNFEAAMDKIAAMTDREIAGKMLQGMERIAGNLTEQIREAKDGV
jgi:CHASE3 domain sensor protein